MNPLRDPRARGYDYYVERARGLQARAAAAGEVDWARIKLEAEQLARTCPFFDIARLCFRIIAQATEQLQATEEKKDEL